MTDEVAELAPRLRRFSIEIAATPGAVYDCWSQFEESPRFSPPAVLPVKQIDPSHVVSEPIHVMGCRRSWESRDLAVPSHRLAWRSVSGTNNAGWVELSPLASSRTRLELCLNYQPNGFLERVADAFGWIDAGIRRDLQRFGRFAESASARRQL